MWTRADLKAAGKISFKRVYWKAVLVCLIFYFISGFISGGSNSGSTNNYVDYDYYSSNLENYDDGNWDPFYIYGEGDESGFYFNYEDNTFPGFIYRSIGKVIETQFQGITPTIFLSLGIVFFIASLALSFLFLNPLAVGKNYFFMGIRNGEREVWDIFHLFKGKHFIKPCVTMFFVDLFTFLWTLLFIIPGIIKAYEYRMIPYLLAENPDMDRSRAFELSHQMMSGQKFDTFVLDLSFLGWDILSIFTLGLLNIFYINPYREATSAELYAVLRQKLLDDRFVSEVELPGFN